MQCAAIPSWAITLHPQHRWDARYWLRVADWLARQKLDMTRENVTKAFAGLDAEEQAAREEAKSLRAEAQRLVAQARALETPYEK